MKKNKKRIVYDKQENEYELTGKIGEGGQGIVLSTSIEGVLVKILNSQDELKKEKWLKQIEWTLNQNLSGLNLALPLAQIVKPRIGYVMELMDGLTSLQDVLEESYLGLVEEQSIAKYLETGGLRRRLKILSKIAKTLSELHSRGYAYGDISPANIFVSENVLYSEVWLIDCDNLCFNEKQGSTHVFTPGYGAPEVVKYNSNVNCLTDAWSFAVMAFELLTHQHPFKGKLVDDGEPELVEQQAYEGDLPWVYNEENCSNESSGGIDLALVANTTIQELFSICFTDGMKSPHNRPSLSKWRDSLQEAVDQLIDCDMCGANYFYNADLDKQICTICESTTPSEQYLVFQQVICSQGQAEAEINVFPVNNPRVLNEGNTLDFSSSPYNSELWFSNEASMSISLVEGNVEIIPNEGAVFEINRNEQSSEFKTRKRVPQSNRSKSAPYHLVSWFEDEIEDDEHLDLVKSYRWTFS